jgi:2-dehydro-3-deoxyglucarate aldolase
MKRLEKILSIRQSLKSGGHTIGSWMQIPHGSIAEIMGQAGYDWVAIDMEHGTISHSDLPDLFRALELGGTLPLVRLAEGHPKDCKQALDAGAGGIIVPMIESAEQLIRVRNECRWPPAGTRGVGFSRANLFGKNFEEYKEEAQKPLLVAMIEHFRAVDNMEDILQVEGLDAIMVGPYDLSASMGITGEFEQENFIEIMHYIQSICEKCRIRSGVHIVNPIKEMLNQRINEGYGFIAYSIDSVFLNLNVENPAKR